MSGSYRELRVWQQAMELSKRVYRSTEGFPKREWFCLAQQMRRAAVSIASNVAEGKGRRTDKDFSNFLYVARGSLLEQETQILLARELQYLSEPDSASLLSDCKGIGSALTGLIHSLQPEELTTASR